MFILYIVVYADAVLFCGCTFHQVYEFLASIQVNIVLRSILQLSGELYSKKTPSHDSCDLQKHLKLYASNQVVFPTPPTLVWSDSLPYLNIKLRNENLISIFLDIATKFEILPHLFYFNYYKWNKWSAKKSNPFLSFLYEVHASEFSRMRF